MDLYELHPVIAWRRCNRRRWPRTHELSFSAEQVRKRRHVLLYIWAGRGVRTTPEGDVDIYAGCCHWSRPGFDYHVVQEPDDPLGITAIHFDLVDADGHLRPPGEEAGALPPELLTVQYPDLTQSITDHVADLAMNIRAGVVVHERALGAAAAMFEGLLDELLAHTDLAGRHERRSVWSEITRYIHEHLAELPSVERLAERWGYSRSHFSREFREHVGLAPLPFIINARTALAKELLRETELGISQIAEQAGYHDIYSFSRQFRQVTGMPPTAYRASAT